MQEARAQLAIDGTDFDTQIETAIGAATGWAEDRTNRRLIAQQWRVSYQGFPCGPIRLPFGRCLSVAAVRYRDPAGDWHTMTGPSASPAGTDYEEELAGDTGGLLFPNFATRTWPAPAPGALYTVRVDATFGYVTGTESPAVRIPDAIRQAILCRVTDIFEGRGPEDAKWTAAAETLLAPYALALVS